AFIVMEYVPGETLAAKLRRGRMRMEDVLQIGRQLAAALCAAHTEGVIHRDIKPGNIQVTPVGSVKVLDFGVARTLESLASSTAGTTRRPQPRGGQTLRARGGQA